MTDQDIESWLRSMPDSVQETLGSVTVFSFLREERNRQFQLVGMYDGAMSEECKQLCQVHYETLDAIVKRLEISRPGNVERESG